MFSQYKPHNITLQAILDGGNNVKEIHTSLGYSRPKVEQDVAALGRRWKWYYNQNNCGYLIPDKFMGVAILDTFIKFNNICQS